MFFGRSKKIDKNRVAALVTEFQAETAVDIVKVTPVPAAKVSLTGSKFGGLFYLPKGCSVPENAADGQLYLLAQINCAELPANSVYPPEGIVQFWIDASDDHMGLSFEDSCSDEGKRVIYYREVGEHYREAELKDLYNPQKSEDGKFYTPLARDAQFQLSFNLAKQSLSRDDYRFESIFVRKWNEFFPQHQIEEFYDLYEKIDEGVDEQLEEAFIASECTQIGGYGFFTQTDIRDEEEYGEYTEILLQIDSTVPCESEIMWGDMGIGNFFATKAQLKNLDFTRCLYTWDC